MGALFTIAFAVATAVMAEVQPPQVTVVRHVVERTYSGVVIKKHSTPAVTNYLPVKEGDAFVLEPIVYPARYWLVLKNDSGIKEIEVPDTVWEDAVQGWQLTVTLED